jgi:hypothetical protein
MANQKVTLLRHAKLPELGWRRGRPAIGKTGKIRPDYMLLGSRRRKREVHAPDGHYELRYFDGKNPRYKDVGNDATEALDQLKRAEKELVSCYSVFRVHDPLLWREYLHRPRYTECSAPPAVPTHAARSHP